MGCTEAGFSDYIAMNFGNRYLLTEFKSGVCLAKDDFDLINLFIVVTVKSQLKKDHVVGDLLPDLITFAAK